MVEFIYTFRECKVMENPRALEIEGEVFFKKKALNDIPFILQINQLHTIKA